MDHRLRGAGTAAGFATALFWGVSFLSIKVAVAVIPPMTLGFVRFAIAVLILLGLKTALAPGDRLERRDLPALAGGGIIGVSLYFFMENNGVLLTTASEASIIIGAIPVLSLLADRFFAGARLSPRQYLGAALSTLGVWLTVAESLRASSAPVLPPEGSAAAAVLSFLPGVPPKAVGYLFMLGAAVSWIAYGFISKGSFRRHERITVVYWQSLFGLAGFIPFTLLEAPQWRAPSAAVWLNVAFLAVFCSALGYWLYALTLETLGVTVSSVFINLIPVISAVSAFLVLGERLSALQWLGMAVVVAGVFLACLPPLSRPSLPSSGRPGPSAPRRG